MKNKVFPLWKKIVAFFAVIMTAAVFLLSVAGIIWCSEENYYGQKKDELWAQMMDRDLRYEAADYLGQQIEDAVTTLNSAKFAYVKIYNSNNKLVSQFDNGTKEHSRLYEQTYDFFVNEKENYVYYDSNFVVDNDKKDYIKKWKVEIGLDINYPGNNSFRLLSSFIDITWALRYLVFPGTILGLTLLIYSMIFLFCSVGHKEKGDEPYGIWETKIPLDLLTLCFLCIGYLICAIFYNFINDFVNDSAMAILILGAIWALIVTIICLYYLVSLALRIKTRTLWSNNLCVKLFKWVNSILGDVFSNRSISGKVAIAFAVLGIVEFLGVCVLDYPRVEELFICILCEKILLFVVISKLLIPVKELLEAGKQLAAGNLTHQINTEKMIWDIKAHGENLNKISTGMTIAVEQKMQSERMKTELITNVSHDIKTPLTSIINYTDLIQKEKTDNKKIDEYCEVLNRQSLKLKRLIEDLVEASKAATGNLEVELVPCDANIFVGQAQGEYEEKFEKANLTLVTKLPDKNIRIMADGRRMWRVFDNLLNNICKYSASGTRVYLNLEEKDGQAVISFKNTSREPLDLSGEELMERFVRGDKSRNTEGNGLGLSIAKSLTELQGGNLEISTDGDLFKAVLKFNII